jgi:cellobiose PTS system EIIB component
LKRFGGKQFYIKYEKMAMPLLTYKIIIEMKLRSNKMKKILLCCVSGMSTSMLVNRMRAVAKENNVPVEIDAVGVEKFSEAIKTYDVALLGPQIKFKYDEFVKIAATVNKKVQVIDSVDYGKMDGKKVLSDAIKLIKSSN